MSPAPDPDQPERTADPEAPDDREQPDEPGRTKEPERTADPEQTSSADAEEPAGVLRARPRPVDEEPVLPGQTSDDLDADWRDREVGEGSPDDRYLRERPPHW